MALPPGWYPVTGDAPGTQRYWDGSEFTSRPRRGAHARRGRSPVLSSSKWGLAGPMARLTATLVDAVAPIAVVYGGGHAAGYEVPGADLGRWAAETDLLIVIAGWLIINHVILVGVLGLTLGKAFLGLRVVDARTRTRSPGLMRALTRSVLLMPGILVTIAYFAFGRRLAFHDLIAGTAVVYA